MGIENKVAVDRKAGYGKLTNFNAVTCSAGESDVIKVSISCAVVSKTFWAHDIIFSHVCRKEFHINWCYSMIGHDMENNPHQYPYGHWVTLHCWI